MSSRIFLFQMTIHAAIPLTKTNFPYVNRFFLFALSFIWLTFLYGCSPNDEAKPSRTERTEIEKAKDSVYYYYNLYSLWSNDIPHYENLSSFTDQYSSPNDVLQTLKAYTPYLPVYSTAIDRFSYLREINSSHMTVRAGQNYGYGVYFQLGAISDTAVYPIVYFVEGGSPAHKGGIHRSDRAIEINGEKNLLIPATCNNIGCKIEDQEQFNKVMSLVNNAETASKMDLTVIAQGKELSLSLTPNIYTIEPLLKDTIFEYPEVKIGYFALSSFENLNNGVPLLKVQLDQVFQSFENAEINDLVIDLRYNTGGAVKTAEYLANKISTPNADQQLMITYATNDYLKSSIQLLRASVSFKPVYFERNNQLQLRTVYFLVTEETASASELLINVLKPYMNVQIIAEKERTFGKPIGFFEQNIMNKISLWVASFKMVNANGETDYWEGLTANKSYVEDFIFRDFGNPEEHMLATAISHSRTGSYTKITISPRAFIHPFDNAKETVLQKINLLRRRETF